MSLIPPQTPNSPVQPVAGSKATTTTTTPPPTPSPPSTYVPPANTNPGTLVAAANAAPRLTSQTLVGVAASSTNANDAAVKAQVTQAYQEASKMVDSLNKTGVDFQHTFYQSASPALKSLLAAAGYAPPNIADVAPNNQGGGGFWHGIIHAADNVRHAGAAALDFGVMKPLGAVGQAFNAAAAPINQLTRDSMDIAQQQDMANAAAGHAGSLHGAFAAFNPIDLINNWHSVANGAASYQPEAIQYVQKEMGITGPTLQLAKIIAGGGTLQAALTSVPASQRASAFALIETTPKFMDAVQLLSDSHLSLGQVIFGGLSSEQTHQLYPDVSTGSANAYALTGQAVGAATAGAIIAKDPKEGIGALKGITTLGGAAGAATAGYMTLNSIRGALLGKTPDVVDTVSPFGLKIHPLSGVVDGLVQWYMNPLFVGLQSRGAYNSAAHAMAVLDANGNAVDVGARYLNQAPERAWAQKFVNSVTTPWKAEHGTYAPTANVTRMSDMGISLNAEWTAIVQREYPKLLEAAKAQAAGDADAVPRAVGTMLGDQQAQINIMRGRLGAAMHDAQQIPHLTIPQRVTDAIKGIGESTFQGKRFNPDSMSYRELSLDAFGKSITEDGMALAEATDQKLGHAARFLRRPTNLVLDKTIIKYADPRRIELFRQLARYALPEDRIDELTNAYALLGPADEGKQFTAIKSMIGEVMHAGNVDRTPEGADWMNTVLASMENASGEGEMYASASDPTAPMTSKAIFPTELADAVAVPSYADYYHFAKKSWFMNQLELRLNSDLFDRFMSKYWKRSMLLRSGFALRFGGEEVLSDILRNGPSNYLKGRVVASLYDTANPTKEAMRAAQVAIAEAAQKELLANGGDISAINEMDTSAAYQALASHIPQEALDVIKTPEQLKASIQAFSAMNWMRRIGVAYVGDETLAAAYNLARRGVLDSTFQDYIDAVTGHGTVYFGDIPKEGDEQALIRHEDGTPLQFRPTGKFKMFHKEEAIPAWSYRLAGVKNTEVGRNIARAYAYGGTDAQMQTAMDWINGVKIQSKIDEATTQFNEAAAKWAKAGSKESGPAWEYLDASQGNLDAAEAEMERHTRLINKFEVNFQTQGGATQEAGTATREEIVRDWARAMVRKVNRLTFTPEGQDFDKEGERIPLTGDPQPIRLLSTVPGREPYQIATRDVGREVTEVEDSNLAYHGVPKDNVRLFRSHNTIDAKENPARPGMGRAWTPNYQHAVNDAGEYGKVYKIDVPVADLKDKYDFHAPEGTDQNAYIREIQDAQHAGAPGKGTAPAVNRGYFESGDIRHGAIEGATKRTLLDEIARGVVPGNDELSKIDTIHIPDHLSMPEQVVKMNPGSIDKFMTSGMRNVVGRPANWISRQPIFTHNYTTALNETTKMLTARGIEDDSGDLAHDVAMERAFNNTIPYIHSPSSKSQMSVIVRNLAPFWFAQEQFYKRWGRLFGTYPEAWYKLQLTMNGLKSVGFIFTDQYGKEAFVYPGSQAVLSFLSKYPFHGSIPVGAALSGEVGQLNPTLTTGGAPIPSLGPIVTIPLSIAGGVFPGAQSITQHFFGPEAPQQTQDNWILNTIEQLTPSILNRGYQWVSSPSNQAGADNVSQGIYMSTMIMAAQQLEVSGHGLSPADQGNQVKTQQYMDRLANWTKNLLLMRTVFGFLSTTVPTFKIADGGLGAQLTALMATMPYDQAVAAFIKAHPNATADTIFESTTSARNESGTYVPATKEALGFMQQNADFFKNFSQIAPYSIPAAAGKGLFNSNVYNQEIAMDLRTRRPLFSPDLVGSWYGQMKYAEGANIYYPEETLFQAAGSATAADAAVAQATLGMTAEQALATLKLPAGSDVKSIWNTWKTDFENTHPLFTQQATAVGAVSSARRGNIVDELQKAIVAGAMPKGEWSTRTEQLMAAYQLVQAAYPAVKGTTQATENWQAFVTWGTAFAQLYPVVGPLWNSVLSKQKVG